MCNNLDIFVAADMQIVELLYNVPFIETKHCDRLQKYTC